MTSSRIGDAELEVIQAAVSGETADFLGRKDSSGQPATTVIRGHIIRHLLLGLPLPTRANNPNAPHDRHTIASNGVRVRGARVEGVIDLSDSAGQDGNGCFPLLLEDCVLAGEGEAAYQDPSDRPAPALDAGHARLSRLSLKNCRAGFINLADAELLGDLELHGLKALSEGGQCRVEARNARIDGSIRAPAAQLNLRQVKLDKLEAAPADYALQLAGAEISGDVTLRPRFSADGGVNIASVHVRGDLWADGAHLTAQGNYAVYGQCARVDGIMGLPCLFTRAPKNADGGPSNQGSAPERFRAEGALSFLSAEFGSLDLRGSILRRKPDEEQNVFTLSYATIRQTIYLNQWSARNEQGGMSLTPFEVDYPVYMTGTKVAGSVQADGAKFNGPPPELGFCGNNLEVGGDLTLNHAEANKVSLWGAKVVGSLEAMAAKFSAPPSEIGLELRNIEVGGDLTLNHAEVTKASLWGAKVTGSLHAVAAKFNAPASELGFMGNNLEVGGDLTLTLAASDQASLWGAKIAQSLVLIQTRFTSIHAQNVRVGGNVYWSGELNGMGSFQGACVDGEMVVGIDKQNQLQLVHEEGSSPEITLEDSRVTRDLKIWGLEVLERNRFDWAKYTSVRLRTRRLACYEGWQLCEAIFEQGAGETRSFAVASLLLEEQGGSLVVLDGLSNTILGFNGRAGLLLKTSEQASDYLKFFCAHIWSDAGAFRVVESQAEVNAFAKTAPALAMQIDRVTLSLDEKENKWKAAAFFVYGQKLFKSSLRIGPDGSVEMLDDTHIADLTGEPLVTYSPPVRFVRDTTPVEAADSEKEELKGAPAGREWNPPPAIDSPASWSELPAERAEALKNKILDLIEFRPTPADAQHGRKSKINLKGSRVGSLEDNYGMSWGDQVILDLEGFEYDRFDVSQSSAGDFDKASQADEGQRGSLAKKALRKILRAVTFGRAGKGYRERDVWQHRVGWLGKQYSAMPPTHKEYKSQPFEQVAKVLRSQGDSDQATRILIEKLRLERKVRFSRRHPKRLGYWIIDRFFGYGIFWGPVFLTFLLCWVAGWLAVDLANYGHLRWPPVGSHGAPVMSFITLPRPVLVVDATSVNTLALTDDMEQTLNASTAAGSVTSSPDGRLVKEIRCGDQIEPALYALDVFVPLLDLKQESKCTISAEHDEWPWRVLKSVYAILGWIVTSALILTVSGIVRRQVER